MSLFNSVIWHSMRAWTHLTVYVKDDLENQHRNPNDSFLMTLFPVISTTARAALLTGRLPVRNGFYTTNGHGRNGTLAVDFYFRVSHYFVWNVQCAAVRGHGKFYALVCFVFLAYFYSIHTTDNRGRNLQRWDFVATDAEEKGLCQQDSRQMVSSLSLLQVSQGFQRIRGDDRCIQMIYLATV